MLTTAQAVELAEWCLDRGRTGVGEATALAIAEGGGATAPVDALARTILAWAPASAAADALVALVEALDNNGYPSASAPWWGVWNENEDCLWCVGCQRESQKYAAPDEEEGWESITHAPDCAALAAEAAVRAMRAAGGGA